MSRSQIVHIPAHLVASYAITKRRVSKSDRKFARKLMRHHGGRGAMSANTLRAGLFALHQEADSRRYAVKHGLGLPQGISATFAAYRAAIAATGWKLP